MGVGIIRPNGCEGTVLIAFFADDDEALLIAAIGLLGMVIRDDQTLHQGLGRGVEGMI